MKQKNKKEVEIINEITFQKIFNYVKIFTIFSIFTGIIYQYVSLKWNLAFFSYSQVVNDSILVIPLVFVYWLSILSSYKYYEKIFKYLNKKIYINLLLTIIYSFIILAFLKFKIDIFSFKINYFWNFLIIYLLWLFLFNTYSHIILITSILDSNESVLNFKKYPYIIFWIIFYIIILFNFNSKFYKNLCITENWINYIKIEYMNDKYLFLNNWRIIKSISEVNNIFRLEKCY